MEGYSILKKFRTEEEAIELSKFLKEYQIEAQVENNKQNFDVTFAFDTINETHIIYVKYEDFERSKELLLNFSDQLTESISSDHYLYDFSDEELVEVVANQDDWNEVDFQLSLKILEQRGISFCKEEIENLKQKKIEELKKQIAIRSRTKTWVILLLFVTPPISMIVGTIFLTKSIQLPNGEKHYSYNLNRRNFGRSMLIVGGVLTAVAFVLRRYFEWF